MTERKIMKLASRGKRFGAACIDAFVPIVSYMLYTAVMAANGIKAYDPGFGYGYDFGYGYGYGFDYGYGIGNRLTGASAAIMIVVFLILVAYLITEFILFAKGKSIGKAILGLQVVSSNNGKPFRFWRMFFRELFVKSASGSVFGLGYIWVLIDDKNRGWHDKILDSYVVDVRESERMDLSRHIAKAQAAAAEPAPVPAEEQEPEAEIVETEPLVPETVGETVIEITPEDVEEISEEVIGDPAEKSDTAEAAAEESEAEAKSEKAGISMSMKKEELLEEARARGVNVSARATKAAIIEAIEKAAEDTEE